MFDFATILYYKYIYILKISILHHLRSLDIFYKNFKKSYGNLHEYFDFKINLKGVFFITKMNTMDKMLPLAVSVFCTTQLNIIYYVPFAHTTEQKWYKFST